MSGPLVQAALIVGDARDRFEVEADRVAEQVIARLGRRSGNDTTDRREFDDDPSDGHAAPVAQLSRVQRSTMALPPIGAAGGEVDDSLASRIQRSRGAGHALPNGLRSSMEGAFGAEFGAVRTHAGPEATALNHDLGARAFTVGSDIFFGEGQFQPGTRAGQRLLAHELAHTLQQGDPSRVQRKLAFEDTQWANAGYLDASKGGGGGVLFVGETGRDVVVKPGEEMAKEAALASMLHIKIGKGAKKTQDTIALAPGLRVAAPDESHDIKEALTPLLDQVGANAADTKDKKFLQDRARGLIGRLDQPGVVIQDLASGKEFKDALKEVPKHTEKKLFGGRELRKESPLRIFTDARAIHALGATTAVDLFTGNRDRLLMFNPENFMVSPYSVTMIDNIWMGTEMSYFQTTEVEGRGGKKFTITADEGLEKWKRDPDVQKLAAEDYTSISTKVWNAIVASAASATRDVDQAAFAKVMKGKKSKFINTFNEGLAAGKMQLMVSLKKLMNNSAKLQKLVPGADLTEILETIKRRKEFLEGGE